MVRVMVASLTASAVMVGVAGATFALDTVTVKALVGAVVADSA